MPQYLKLKIPPPVVAILFALLIWAGYRQFSGLNLNIWWLHPLALIFLTTAFIIDMWALISFLKARTTIDPRFPHKSSRIITHGVYQYTRNPMYLGLTLMLIALSLWLGSWLGMIAVAAFILYISYFQIREEEIVLEQKFGEQYRQYKAEVRRWI